MIIQERRTTHPTLQNNNNKMRWQRRMISGVFLEASSIDVMSRNDNTYMCHKTAHFLFHCNTWALFGEQTFVWTCCRNTELMINWKRRWWPETVRAIDWFHLIHNTAILLHLKDICGPREFTNIQATSRPEYQQYIYVSFARSMVKHVKEILSTKKNSIGQNKCRSSAIPENCEKFIILIASEDLEFEDMFKNVRRKLESHMESAVPCKSQTRSGNTTLKTSKVSPQEQQCDEHRWEAIPCDDKIRKTIYGQKIEAHEPPRCRFQEYGNRGHEENIADRGCYSFTHYDLAHKPIPIS